MVRQRQPCTDHGAHNRWRARGLVMLLAALLFSGPLSGQPAGAATGAPNLALSPGLLELLRAEMLEVASGMQVIALALASGDWQAVANTSAKIRASYILEQRLTPDQIRELELALPDGFKRIDADFHRRAERLHDAAKARDPEMAAFHYSRLIESCAACHASYAQARFPGFATAPQDAPVGGHAHE